MQLFGLAGAFRALGEPTRLAILERAALGPVSVGELASGSELSLASISKHVTVLEEAGLVRRSRRGRTVLVDLRPERVADAASWLARATRFWAARLDELADHLAAEPEQEHRDDEDHEEEGG